MAKVPYIDYKTLEDSYTLPQVCKMLGVDKAELKAKCNQLGIKPRRNEIGDFFLVKYDVRKLHNAFYYENKDHEADAWDW